MFRKNFLSPLVPQGEASHHFPGSLEMLILHLVSLPLSSPSLCCCDHECVFIVAHLWAVLLVRMLVSPGFASWELSTRHSTQRVLSSCRVRQV